MTILHIMDYTITSNDKAWIINKKLPDGTLKPYLYYRSLKSLCSALLELDLRLSNAAAIEMLIKKLDGFNEALRSSRLMEYEPQTISERD